MTKLIFLLFLSFLHIINATSINVNQIRSKNSYIPNSITDEDLVKSYLLISSDVPKSLVKGLPTMDHRQIARCYIDNNINGSSLWHSLESDEEMLSDILLEETNEGDVDTIFKSLNEACKYKYKDGYFTDKELAKYIEQQEINLTKHISKHVGVISDLPKERDNSVFLFFDKSKSLRDKLNFLLTTALSSENIKYIKEENDLNGPCVVVYSKLPKLEKTKLLGSAILGNDDCKLIAVRNYLGQCGIYLTDTVKISFRIEKSNIGNLIRFRISTIYPCDPLVLVPAKKGDDKRGYDNWSVEFSSMARMALLNPTTMSITLDFLINYVDHYQSTGKSEDTGVSLSQYLQDISLESCFLNDLAIYVIMDKLWCIRDFIEDYKDILSNNMEATLEKIENYRKRYAKLQETDSSQTLLDNLRQLAQGLETDNLSSDTISYISNMLSLFTQTQWIMDKMHNNLHNNLFNQQYSRIEKYFENIDTLKKNTKEAFKAVFELNDQINVLSKRLLDRLEQEEKEKVNSEDAINNIENSIITSSEKESSKPKRKKNKKSSAESTEDINEDVILLNAVEQVKKERETLITNYNNESKALFTNVLDIQRGVEKYLTTTIFITDEKKIEDWNKEIKRCETQVPQLKAKYGALNKEKGIQDYPKKIKDILNKLKKKIENFTFL